MRVQSFAIHYNPDKQMYDYLVPLTFDFEEEEGKWVGVCLELGTSSFADTLEELRKEIGDAVTLHLQEMEQLGFIAEFLQDHNARPVPLPSVDKQQHNFSLAGV